MTRLTAEEVKVLAAIKFNPTSITREEIMEKTQFSTTIVEKNVKSLLAKKWILKNARFPSFPATGWRVYTQPDKHTEIINKLREGGFEHEQSSITRARGYYPTGMQLEGEGQQENRNRYYPPDQSVNVDLQYRPQTIAVMKHFRDTIKPFRPREYSEQAVAEKFKKFQWLNLKLSKIYKIPTPTLRIGLMTAESWSKDGSSGTSNYNRATNTITLNGKFSVTTFIHEYAHARGFDETDAVMWSYNLYQRTFPVSSSRMINDGHMIIRRPAENFNAE